VNEKMNDRMDKWINEWLIKDEGEKNDK